MNVSHGQWLKSNNNHTQYTNGLPNQGSPFFYLTMSTSLIVIILLSLVLLVVLISKDNHAWAVVEV